MARLHVKPSTIPELLRAGAHLFQCGTLNRCGTGRFHVGSTESEADAIDNCALQIAANAASCLVRREGSLEFDSLPAEVQDAAKLAYDGHPADHEEDDVVMGRLSRFLLPPRRGVCPLRGWPRALRLVAPGHYEYPTADLAASAAHDRNPNIREENERPTAWTARLAALAEKLGRQNEVPDASGRRLDERAGPGAAGWSKPTEGAAEGCTLGR